MVIIREEVYSYWFSEYFIVYGILYVKVEDILKDFVLCLIEMLSSRLLFVMKVWKFIFK